MAGMSQRSEPSRRRPLACDPCRKRKLRCDRHMPCSMCLRSRREQCCYGASQPSGPQNVAPEPASTTAESNRDGPLDEALHDLPGPSGAFESSSTSTASVTYESPTEGRLATGTWHCSELGSVFICGTSQDSSNPESGETGWGDFFASAVTSTRPSRTLDPIDLQPRSSQMLMSLRGSVREPKPSPGGIATPIKGMFVNGRFLGQTHWVQALTLVRLRSSVMF